jgi:CheY-like chemotaxis protein
MRTAAGDALPPRLKPGLTRALRPALLVLDLHLPYLDGRALAAAYRRAPGPRAPVLVVPADGGATGAAAAASAAAVGATAVLGKPFDLAELLALVSASRPDRGRSPVSGPRRGASPAED